MKGLAHFISGIAAASFLPGVVRLSAEGGYPLLLAGVGALLPDVLDFRLTRFLQWPDSELSLDAEQPDPRTMAAQIGAAVDRAIEGARPVILRLPAARTAAGLWRRYTVALGTEVRVRIGPLVSTSGAPARGTAADGEEGIAPVAQPVQLDYGRVVQVDAFAGPTIALQGVPGGVRATFLPWHRTWSHSLLVAAALAVAGAIAWRPLYGILVGTGAVAHIIGDQLGYMGSNLLWPITRRRTRGIGLFHSEEALPNLLAVWLGVLVLAYNLDRASPSPTLQPLALFGLGAVLPCAVLIGASRWQRRKRLSGATDPQAAQIEDLRAEDEMELG